MAFHKITLTVNGETDIVNVPSQMTLMQMLREKLVLTGTKNGCATSRPLFMDRAVARFM